MEQSYADINKHVIIFTPLDQVLQNKHLLQGIYMKHLHLQNTATVCGEVLMSWTTDLMHLQFNTPVYLLICVNQ